MTCQHNMGEVGRAKPLAVFIRRDCLICRCMEKFPTSSVTHLKSRVSTKFPCSIEEKLISGTNIHNMYIYIPYIIFEKVQNLGQLNNKKKVYDNLCTFVAIGAMFQILKFWDTCVVTVYMYVM